MVQAWIYFRRNRDSWLLRLLVASLVALDFTATVLNSQTVYTILVTNFGNSFGDLENYPTTFKTEVLISFVVIFIVNTFFAYRIYLLRQIHRSVAFIVFAIGTAALVVGLIASVRLLISKADIYMSAEVIQLNLITSLSLSVISDILSSAAISWSLHKSRTGFKRIDSLTRKFFHIIVGRGLLLSLDQIITLLALTVRMNLDWVPSHFILTRLYVITLVAMLNSRPGLEDDVGSVAIDDEYTLPLLDDSVETNNHTAVTASEDPIITGEEANRRYLHFYPSLEETKGSAGSMPKKLDRSRQY